MDNQNTNMRADFVEQEIDKILAVKRAFATADGKKALEMIKHYSLAGQQAYVAGMPPEHTIFRNGCQQPYIDLKEILETPIKQLEQNLKDALNKEEPYEL